MLWWFLLVIGLSLQTAAPRSMSGTAAHQLGLLLDLPMDADYISLKRKEAPQYVKDIYECWSGSSSHTDDCLPGYHGSDVNLLRTSLGVETESPLPALHSYNPAKEIKNSLEISFNMSHTTGQTDIIRYAMLRVHRDALSPVKLDLLHNCNISDLRLQLYSQTSMKGQIPLFSLRAVQSLSSTNFSSEEWVQFLNLTKMYRSLMDTMNNNRSAEIHSTRNLRIRLVMSGGECPDLSPSDLGFGCDLEEHRSQLIGLAENKLQKDFKFSSILSSVVKDRIRRAAAEAQEMETGSGSKGQPIELSTKDPPKRLNETVEIPTLEAPPISATVSPSDIVGHTYTRCSHHEHYISFSDIGLGDVFISPKGYYANYCSGMCNWPQDAQERTNHHSSIQSHANFINSELIPPPCCTPRPDSLGKLVATIKGGTEDEVMVQIYDDMIANECGCF